MRFMADEGIQEIQLSAKQLIFLFMTAAVVLVVTFLCGVLVGRGVRSQKESIVAAETLTQAAPAAADPTASAVTLQPAAKVAPQSPPATAPPPAEEDLSYYSRLEGQAPPAEGAKPVDGAKGAKGAERRPPRRSSSRRQHLHQPPSPRLRSPRQLREASPQGPGTR